MADRAAVTNFLRALYDPVLRSHLALGRHSQLLLKQSHLVHRFQTDLFNYLGHLPPRVLAAETDRWELVYHFYYLLRFLRHNYPAWHQPLSDPLPALPLFLAPGVHTAASTILDGLPGSGPAEAGFPDGWPLPLPTSRPAPDAPSSGTPSTNPAPASSSYRPRIPILLPERSFSPPVTVVLIFSSPTYPFVSYLLIPCTLTSLLASNPFAGSPKRKREGNDDEDEDDAPPFN
ncbi:hypothetical protein N7461_008430 [Penicillium sp. DV-2018c]|nr:hypothetical protein N7461_008430 [Penicillium sp. DV-2018c]